MEYSKHGFYVRKLTLGGDKVITSSIEFEKGLNIIYGGSDIGKTFIYQCIDFMLGSEKKPKEIKESKGYIRYELIIKTYKGTEHKIYRDINDSHFLLDDKTILYSNNNDSKITISDFLLSLTNMENKKIKIDKYGDTQSLYFQNLKLYFLLDEDNIIARKSNIAGYKLKEKSTFRFIITEKDDENIKKIESNENIKSKEIEINLLKNKIASIELKLKALDENTLLSTDNEIHNIKVSIRDKKNELEEINKKILINSIKRDELKNKVYCPKCGKELHCNCSKSTSLEVNTITVKDEENIRLKNKLEVELSKLDDDYQKLTRISLKNNILRESLKKYITEVKRLTSEVKKGKKAIDKIKDKKISSSSMNPITDTMLNILKRIEFDNILNVEFSQIDLDFLINGEKRGIFGQGYRAIIYATFLIAVLEYLYDKSYQVGFTIIDSPFNPYKIKERETKNLAHNFYKYLDENQIVNELQVIIFENTKPPEIFYKKKKVRTFFEGKGFLKGEVNLFNYQNN